LKSDCVGRRFYLRDATIVAVDLLGKELVCVSKDGITSGIIVEVEAYIGPLDKGSHAFNNKRTKRTKIQYKIGGFAYVYQVYGMHFCFNVTTQDEGRPEVVLVRAIEPVIGVSVMKMRRIKCLTSLAELTNGPGKLCQSMGIDLKCYGEDLCGEKLFIRQPSMKYSGNIFCSSRINIDYAGEDAKLPWRYFFKDNSFVSCKNMKESTFLKRV
jgi:DNA-3-methyladenine glycosylase